MNDDHIIIVTCLTLLVAAVVGTAGVGTVSASGATCDTTVRHDAFLGNSDAISAAQNGSSTSVEQNTEVTITDTSGGIRLDAQNPNGYCTKHVVRISSDIMSPATLGDVDAESSNLTASWTAVEDFEAGEVHTKVVYALPAGSNATFAPSEPRMMALSWTGKAEDADILGRLFGDDEQDLEQSSYNIEPREGASVTVDLTSSQNTVVDEWQASYEGTPISQDADSEAYYTEDEQANTVTFHFAGDADSDVEFDANPGPLDKATHQVSGYVNQWGNIGEMLGFGQEDN